ncbi:MAG: beta-lactamase family protein [Chitinispirillia bacterium]|nr:beta-lactamase family protein [Chitinispirillia bacterium]
MVNAEKIEHCLQEAIKRQIFPGCAVGGMIGEEEFVVAAGHHTYDENAKKITQDSLFDCASVTKAIPVSTLALWLIDHKEIKLSDRLIDFVPVYNGSFRDEICLGHLLTHTLDFDFRLSEYKDLPAEKLLAAILNVKMKSRPGEKFCYANATSILLGMLIERVSGKPLHELAQEVFFDPLGMKNTTFFPKKADITNCVPTEIDPWRDRTILGETHDESAWVLRKIMTAGSAGLFSTAPDLMKFVRMLLDGREPFFKKRTMNAMHTNQILHIKDMSTGLGWELNQEYMGTKRTAQTFGKTGFTGCAVIADRSKNAGVVILSNYTWPRRKANRDLINEVRAQIADIVLG